MVQIPPLLCVHSDLLNCNPDMCVTHCGEYGTQQHKTDCMLYCCFVLLKHVPLLVEVCVFNIEYRGLDSQGIYRIPGNAGVVHELQEQLDRVCI